MSKRTQKISDFSRLNQNQLQARLADKRENLRRLRFDLSSGKVKNVRQIRETKKDIARILTLINQLLN